MMREVSQEVWDDLDVHHVIKRRELFQIDDDLHVDLGPRCSYGLKEGGDYPVWFRVPDGEYQISNVVYNLDKLAPTQTTGGDQNCGSRIYVIECDVSDGFYTKTEVDVQTIIDDNLKLCERILANDWLPKPFRMVFSGSKSLHLLYKSDTDVTPKQHRYIHHQLAMLLNAKNYDSQCCNVGRQTRFPNAINQKTGRVQHLLYYRDNTFHVREEWLDQNLMDLLEEEEENTKYIPPTVQDFDINAHASFDYFERGGILKQEDEKSKGLSPEDYFVQQVSQGCLADGRRHENVPRIICALKNKGADLNLVHSLLTPYLNGRNKDLLRNIDKLYNNAPLRK